MDWSNFVKNNTETNRETTAFPSPSPEPFNPPTQMRQGNSASGYDCPTKDGLSMFNKNNPYNYRLNINHPCVAHFMKIYKKKNGIHTICSDKQRYEFEERFIAKLHSGEIKPHVFMQRYYEGDFER